MSLTNELLDAVIDGELGHGLVVTRQEVIKHFSSHPEGYTGVILANSEMSSIHSPNYEKFTIRIEKGKYRIHPQILVERMEQRGI